MSIKRHSQLKRQFFVHYTQNALIYKIDIDIFAHIPLQYNQENRGEPDTEYKGAEL